MHMQQYELPHMGGATIPAKLTAKLIQELKTGIYSRSSRLPSELELAEHFSVSRSVIRDVLANLEREGFVSRGRGIGTVIHRDIVALRTRIDLKYEYNQLVRDAGGRPTADGVRLYEEAADPALAAQLQIEPGTPLIVCEKRILADGKPVIYSVDRLPKSIFAGKDYAALDWSIPIFDILEERCGIVVDTDIAQLTATMGPPEVREIMRVPEGEPMMLVDEIGYYKFSCPILQTYGYYTNYFAFTILRKKF